MPEKRSHGIYCVQAWIDDVWKTVYLASFPDDARLTYDTLAPIVTNQIRLVRFSVDSFDFVAIHGRDFEVITVRG